MRVHHLKTWPVPFQATLDGKKTHEVRYDADRGFGVGDHLVLREFDPDGRFMTDRWVRCSVEYLTPGGRHGIDPNYCVMTVKLLKSGETYGGWDQP